MLRDTVTSVGPEIKVNSEGDILYYHDTKRDKYLGIYRLMYGFGIDHRNISHQRTMSISGGVRSTEAGYPIPRDSTIIGITAKATNSANCSFQILKNGTNIGSFTLTNQTINYNNDIDIDIDQGDYLQILVNPNSGVINFPELTLETSWRF